MLTHDKYSLIDARNANLFGTLAKHSRLLAVCIGFAVAGCSSEEKPKVEEVVVPQKTHYTLRMGKPILHRAPLPDLTEIFVDWHYNTGKIDKVLGFRGWDVSGDGRIDMLEILDEKGEVIQTAFDFDSDGVVDLER